MGACGATSRDTACCRIPLPVHRTTGITDDTCVSRPLLRDRVETPDGPPAWAGDRRPLPGRHLAEPGGKGMACRHAGPECPVAARTRRRGAKVTMDIRTLESPIDTMYVIHRALRAEAARVETLVDLLEEGGSRQPFRQARSEER